MCRAGPLVLNSHPAQQMGRLWSVMLMYIYVVLGVCVYVCVYMMYVHGEEGKQQHQKAGIVSRQRMQPELCEL